MGNGQSRDSSDHDRGRRRSRSIRNLHVASDPNSYVDDYDLDDHEKGYGAKVWRSPIFPFSMNYTKTVVLPRTPSRKKNLVAALGNIGATPVTVPVYLLKHGVKNIPRIPLAVPYIKDASRAKREREICLAEKGKLEREIAHIGGIIDHWAEEQQRSMPAYREVQKLQKAVDNIKKKQPTSTAQQPTAARPATDTAGAPTTVDAAKLIGLETRLADAEREKEEELKSLQCTHKLFHRLETLCQEFRGMDAAFKELDRHRTTPQPRGLHGLLARQAVNAGTALQRRRDWNAMHYGHRPRDAYYEETLERKKEERRAKYRKRKDRDDRKIAEIKESARKYRERMLQEAEEGSDHT